MAAVTLTVNGSSHAVDLEDRTLLVHYLRDTLRLTGTHIGCDTTQCGACTVMLNGVPVKSCTVLLAALDGAAVQTVEGASDGVALHPVQQKFNQHHGLQCGFCTPGMVIAAIGLIERHDGKLTAAQVREGLEGNMCRCTGYQNIVAAVLAAAQDWQPGKGF